MSPLVGGTSYWIESAPGSELPPLAGDLEVDVCVVGGGMTGLLCAWELAEAGRTVAVLERGRVASSVTGYTTAKLTSQHGMKYARLTRQESADAARTYGAINERALAHVRSLAARLGVEGAIEARDAYVYATGTEGRERVEAEAHAAHAAGLPASFVERAPLPFDTTGAVRFEGQAQLHPRRLLLPLVSALLERGVAIHEGSAVSEVKGSAPHEVVTDDGTVRAGAVVVATLLPTAGTGSSFIPSLYCHQGYAVALPAEPGATLPDGVLISAERPMRSLRTIEDADGRMLQVGGAAHVADPMSGASPWDDLEAWAREHFDVGAARFRWTTQDYSSSDGMPLIGAVDDAGTILVATGFGGWGMTTAAVAAGLVASHVAASGDEITRAAARLFDPRRPLGPADDATVSSHTSSGTDDDADAVLQSLPPGGASVVRAGGEQLAAYRTPDGDLQVVSAVCTHLRGIVLWDHESTQWTCPCHGSQFAPDGSVTAGPAKEPLAPRPPGA